MARREALLQEVAHTVVIPVTSFSIPRTSLVRAIYDYDVVEERDSLECGEHRVPLYFLAEIETQRERGRENHEISFVIHPPRIVVPLLVSVIDFTNTRYFNGALYPHPSLQRREESS